MSKSAKKINRIKMLDRLCEGREVHARAVEESVAKCRADYRTHLGEQLDSLNDPDWSPEKTFGGGESPLASLLSRLGIGLSLGGSAPSNSGLGRAFVAQTLRDHTNCFDECITLLNMQVGDEVEISDDDFSRMHQVLSLLEVHAAEVREEA